MKKLRDMKMPHKKINHHLKMPKNLLKMTAPQAGRLSNKKTLKALLHITLGVIILAIQVATLIMTTNLLSTNVVAAAATTAAQQVAASPFPGVSRELASFCSARPSLSIDLAPMIVHVKRNTTFNYKLYLFSNNERVFQTGQVVPRDDFRIHSFPVKLKQLSEFMPLAPQDDHSLEVYQLEGQTGELKRVSSSRAILSIRDFFSMVPLEDPTVQGNVKAATPPKKINLKNKQPRSREIKLDSAMPFELHGDILPGDESFAHHDVVASGANAHIHFDRDDQLAALNAHSSRLVRELSARESSAVATTANASADHNESHPKLALSSLEQPTRLPHQQSLILPVGSFSSFHVNTTYLARKDFDQREAQVMRITIDSQRFRVSQVHLLSGFHLQQQQQAQNETNPPSTAELPAAGAGDDWAFLSHKLLRDANTRITSITQIYEDWITRNFYTIVYVQRRVVASSGASEAAGEVEASDASLSDTERPDHASASDDSESTGGGGSELTTDRLVFRGSSTSLLGADQLDYHVKASAFVTEKNGLHYYLEFLPSGKFYLGAIDWTKRPFKFIDSRSFPIKQTRTLFDNEELLLCPPSVCYSDQPLDEIVSYGRLALSEKFQRDAAALARSSTSTSTTTTTLNGSELPVGEHLYLPDDETPTRFASSKTNKFGAASTISSAHRRSTTTSTSRPLVTTSAQSEPISLDSLIEAVRSSSASSLNVRLHLRDWVWSMPRVRRPNPYVGITPPPPPLQQSNLSENVTVDRKNAHSKFEWHFEWAKRNEVKVTQDTYGFALTGHEIDAAYRVFNELYLISANHLISINYTLPNETVTSVQLLEEEFAGLSSTLLDPITGAFYDRYSNQIYFFKGDRYVGFDYASKKPLEDFLLPPGADFLAGTSLSTPQHPSSGASSATTTTSAARLPSPQAVARQQPLVSSLPVVAILGRQHRVDGIYHDLYDDYVYIFSGMKFYAHYASDFKDGAFKAVPLEPIMRCINEHFLQGCRFDEAYPNPCKSDEQHASEHAHRVSSLAAAAAAAKLVDSEENESPGKGKGKSKGEGGVGGQKKNASVQPEEREGANFSEEQQMKLRSIAARGSGRLIDFLLENTIIAQGAATRAIEPILKTGGSNSQGTSPAPRDNTYEMLAQTNNSQERIVIYLLIAMVLITIMVTVAMIVVILNWAKVDTTTRDGGEAKVKGAAGARHTMLAQSLQLKQDDQLARGLAHSLEERAAYPASALSQYLNNQYHQQQQQQQHQQQLNRRQQLQQQRQQWQHSQRSLRNFYLSTESGGRSSQRPLPLTPSPPSVGPKPTLRMPTSNRSYVTPNGSQLGSTLEHETNSIIDSSAL